MPQNELQRLTQVHLKIMDYCLLGFTRNDIAKAMEMSPEGVGLVINSPLFQDEFARKRQVQDRTVSEVAVKADLEALDILRNAATQAAETHVNLLNSTDQRVAQGSANAILDRVLQKNDTGTSIHLEENIVNLLQITINELKITNLPSAAPVVERPDLEVINAR